MSQREPVSFRRLTDADLPTLHRWLNEPGVVRWWEGDDVSWDAVVRDYGSAATDPTEFYIASRAGRDVGWIQCYATADFAGEREVQAWYAAGVSATAAGIDYLIGEPEDRGRGLGSSMIAAFVDEIVFARHPDWTEVCASPGEANVASWRALARAGFEFVATFDDAVLGECRIMRRRRTR